VCARTSRNRIDVWLLLIGLLAAILRMIQIGLYPTFLDELLLIDSAMQLARQGHWTWLGNPTSFAPIPAHSPLTVYLTAIPLIFTPDWMLTRLWLALFGVIAVGGMYLMLRRYGGQYAAIVGATLLAVMPFPVDWSRFVWNPNYAPPFLVFWLFTGLLGYYEGQRRAQVMHWLLLSAIIQTDAAYIILIPLSLFLTVYGYRDNPNTAFIRTTLIAWSITLITFIPMLIGNIGVRQGIFSYMIHIVPARNPAIHLQLPDLKQMVDTFAILVASVGFRKSIALSELAAWWYPDAQLQGLLWLQVGIVSGSMVWVLLHGWRRKENFPLLWLTVAAVWLFIFYFIDSGSAIPLYFLMLTPFAAVAIFALMLARLWTWKQANGLLAWLFIAAQLSLTLTNLDWYQHHQNLSSPAVLESTVAEWAQHGEIIVIQDEAITPVEQEWFLRWRILAERYPIHTIDAIINFGRPSEAAVLVSDEPLPVAFGESEIYPITSGNLYVVVTVPDE
jgi:4-amino-4-deoxy-L-arabinose transferase-like glycosyltransferase